MNHITPYLQKYLDALESGNYNQTVHVLRRDDCYCAMGLACHVYDPTKWREYKISRYKVIYDYDGNSALAPREVVDALKAVGIREGDIVYWNDSDMLTFKQIATKILDRMDMPHATDTRTHSSIYRAPPLR